MHGESPTGTDQAVTNQWVSPVQPDSCAASLLTQLRAVCRLDRWAAVSPDNLQLVSVDQGCDGRVMPLGGVGLVLERMRALAVARETPPAVLLVGIHEEATLRDQLRTGYGSDALLDWPGVRYLRFVFNDDDLARAAVAALQGRHAPTPLPSSAELLRCLRDARHWVDRQRDVAAGQADNYALVRARRLTYTADMLEPETRISKSHRDLMAHLVACLSLSPSVEHGAAAAKRLSLDFDEMLRLDALIERAKFEAACLHADPAPDLDSLEFAFTAYEKAADAVTARLAALDAYVSDEKTHS